MTDNKNSLGRDFDQHARDAVSEYLARQPFFADLASVVARIIEECLKKREIRIHSVQHRAKDASSFEKKAAIPSDTDPKDPKYANPISDITDLAGVRVIAHFPGTLPQIDTLLREEFLIVERSDKGAELLAENRFGYQSIHYLLQISPERAHLAEYQRFKGATAEVQVRTILQHTWAEIEHDIQYKSSQTIPSEIRRRFMALAGLLEIADREFQAIQDANQAIEIHAKESVEQGNLDGVEITPNALKLFLNGKLTADDRISDWTYDWTARLLMNLGFRDLRQVETAIAPFNDGQLSDLAFGRRHGQTTRFELMLLAALGERFIGRHFYRGHEWFEAQQRVHLEKFKKAGLEIGRYDPLLDPDSKGVRLAEGWYEQIETAQLDKKISINGLVFDRIPYGAEEEDWGANEYPCHDCGVDKGQFHVANCDVERCPACKGQIISCDCKVEEVEVIAPQT